jgi:hypothetical protein
MADKVERVASQSKIDILEEKSCFIDSCYGDHTIFATPFMVFSDTYTFCKGPKLDA